LTFSCRRLTARSSPSKGDVMLLHGFPEWSSMYVGFMADLAAAGYNSIACDQRGYSPGARPEREEDYHYSHMESDVWAVADAVGFDKFHLVAHDHGAVLGWKTAASETGARRILSYSALSIPHTDAFGVGLFGPNADVDQQVASQYFSMFTMDDSASRNFNMLYNMLGTGFTSTSDFQKALWWYNGAYAAGVMAMPPTFSASELLWRHGRVTMSALRAAFSGCDECQAKPEGWAATTRVGNVTMPALYVCGKDDSSILCNKPYALKTQDYCEGTYEYLEVDCGHNVNDCKDSHKVLDGILRNIAAAQ